MESILFSIYFFTRDTVRSKFQNLERPFFIISQTLIVQIFSWYNTQQTIIQQDVHLKHQFYFAAQKCECSSRAILVPNKIILYSETKSDQNLSVQVL